MDFNEYQKEASKTAIFDALGSEAMKLSYLALGVTGEAGEVAEKIKKILRDNDGVVTEEKRVDIAKEMGDVLWYLSQLARELGIDFEDVALRNIEKLQSRMQRDKIKGDGDNR